MRRCIPYLITLVFACAAFASDEGTRAAAYARLHDEARLSKLLKQANKAIKAGRYDDALKAAEAANAIRPNDAIILNAKAVALIQLKRYDEAEKWLNAALELDPKAFAPQFNQAEILSLRKKYADAALRFTSLQERFGILSLLKYKIYLSYTLAGMKDEAAEALGMIRYPEDGPAWYFANAVSRLQAGQKEEANRLMAAAEAIDAGATTIYRDTLRESGLLK